MQKLVKWIPFTFILFLVFIAPSDVLAENCKEGLIASLEGQNICAESVGLVANELEQIIEYEKTDLRHIGKKLFLASFELQKILTKHFGVIYSVHLDPSDEKIVRKCTEKGTFKSNAAARESLVRYRINAALYQRYGGANIYDDVGEIVSLDARDRFVAELVSSGALRIFNEKLFFKLFGYQRRSVIAAIATNTGFVRGPFPNWIAYYLCDPGPK